MLKLKSRPSGHRSQWNLLFWLPLFIATRCLYLFFLHPYFYTLGGGEEPYTASVAVELLSGPIFPIFEYLISDYQGGTLVIASVMSPFISLFGATTFASKLAPLVFFLGALILWVLFARKYFGKRVAFYFALLFTFSPPSFTQFSLTALGYHSESIFFTALSITLFLNALGHKNSSYRYAVLGFVCGFSLWFAYIYAITLLSLMLFWLFQDNRFFLKKSFFFFGIGFLIGFSPWLIFNLPNQFSGLDLYEQKLWDHFQWGYFLSPLSSIRKFVGYYLFGSFGPPFWAFSKFVIKSSALFYSCLLFFPVVASIILNRKSRLSFQAPFFFVILYTVIFLLILQASDFYDPRYFMPLYPFLFLISARSLETCENALQKQRHFSKVYVFTVIAVFLYANHFALSIESPGRALKTKGYAYQWIEQSTCRDFKQCIKRYPEVAAKLNHEDLHEFTSELAAHASLSLFKSLPISEIIEYGKSTPPLFQPYFFYHLGREMIETSEDLSESLEILTPIKSQAKYYSRIKEGIYDNAAYSVFEESPHIVVARSSPSDQELPQFWRYLGKQSGFYWKGQEENTAVILEPISQFLEEIELRHHADFLQGIGQFFYDHWASRPLIPKYDPALLETLPKSYQSDILKGVGIEMANREFYWQVADKQWYFETFTKNLSASSKEFIREGNRNILEFVKTLGTA